MKDVIYRTWNKDVFRDIVPDKLKIRIPGQVLDVIGIPGDQIVDPNDSESLREQSIAQMRTKKARSTGDYRRFLVRLRFKHGVGLQSEEYASWMSRINTTPQLCVGKYAVCLGLDLSKPRPRQCW